jgi:hypothetical protein
VFGWFVGLYLKEGLKWKFMAFWCNGSSGRYGDSMSGKWLNVFNIVVFAQFEM